MNRPELYNKTVDTLLDAYNNDKLEHELCTACAVGNICGGNPNWGIHFCTLERGDKYVQTSRLDMYSGVPEAIEDGLKVIEASGYTIEELMKIEWAFETALPIDNRDYYLEMKPKLGQYMGLRAVLNVLKEIHSTPEKISIENEVKLKTIYQDTQIKLEVA